MPPEESDSMSDASADQAHGNAWNSTEQAQFQEVGTSTSAGNNASEDGDTTNTTASSGVEIQAAADDLAAAESGVRSAGSPVPAAESNTSTSAGVAEAEDDEHNQSHVISNGHAAGGANGVVGNDKDYAEESYVHTEVAPSTAGEEGHANGDDSATDVAVIPSTRGEASAGDETSFSAIPSSGNDNNVPTCAPQEDTAHLNNRTVAAIRRSIHETPGAFYVTPINAPRGEEGTADEEISEHDARTTGNSGSNSNNPDHADAETEQEETSSSDTISQPRRRSTATSPNLPTESHPSIELAEAWVVEEGAAGAAGAANPSAALPPNTSTQPNGHSESSVSSLDIDASVEPAIVTVMATPLKERRWFKTRGGIALILFPTLLLGGIVALAVAFPVRKNASTTAAANRPFDIVIPSMPQDVSDMLEFKYNKLVEGQAVAMTFSADLFLHASSRIDEYFGQLQVVQYNATSSSWDVVAKYDEEAREQDLLKDGQIGNSAGDNFGAWADMSYDGRILAIGLPRDDPLNVPDAGSVRVMELESDNNARWNLKGYGIYIAGVDPYDWTGTTFSLAADGSMIAVASPLASKSRGTIVVYKFEPVDAITDGGAWSQVGQTIVGDSLGLAFAKLSEDGTMLAAGSLLHGKDRGQLRIFRWDDAAKLWVQMGGAIEGNAKSRLGVFPQFSRDGLTVASPRPGNLTNVMSTSGTKLTKIGDESMMMKSSKTVTFVWTCLLMALRLFFALATSSDAF